MTVNSAYQRQQVLEQTVMTASPEQLIDMVYEFCISQFDIMLAQSDSKSWDEQRIPLVKCQKGLAVLMESLADPLRPDLEAQVRDLSTRYGSIYDFLIHELAQADMNQTLPDVGRLRGVLKNLADGWKQGVMGIPEDGTAEPPKDAPLAE